MILKGKISNELGIGRVHIKESRGIRDKYSVLYGIRLKIEEKIYLSKVQVTRVKFKK